MTRQETQIVSSPELITYPYTFNRLIPRQGYEITVTFPTTTSEVPQLLQQAAANNPAQLAAAHAAGTP